MQMHAAPSTSLRKLLSEVEQLFQTERTALAEHLNQAVRRMRQAEGFAEIATILCDASAPFSESCGVFRVHHERVRGEHLRGADGGREARFRETIFAPEEAAAFAGAIDSREPVVALSSAAQVTPSVVELFRHTPTDKAYLFPFAVGRHTVGVLYAAGHVDAAALELLVQSAGAVLEARERSAPLDAGALVRIEPAEAPRSKPATPDWDALSPEDRTLHLRAQRFARVQVAEMRLYHADAVKSGRARRDLYVALKDPIDRGREAFRQTFVTASPTMVDYFHEELVRTLANDDRASLGEQYPGPLR